VITVVGYDGRPVDLGSAPALAVGAPRNLAGAGIPAETPRIELGPLEPAIDAMADTVAAGGDIVVVASGDPGFFGVVRVLADHFGAERLDVRPAASFVAHAFARVGVSWDDAVTVSMHGQEGGRSLRRAINTCLAHRKVAVLTAPGAGPAELGQGLIGTDRTMVVAEELGTAAERIHQVTPEVAACETWTGVNVTLVFGGRVSGGSVLSGSPRWYAGPTRAPNRWGLPETEFEHRDSMITKSEVRALALAHLGPGLGDLVWDLGAGSGSVAVECARFGAAVIAVERDAESCQRIRTNAERHGVDVRIVSGETPAVLAGLPDPDAVFVGGGGLGAVEAAAHRALRSVVVAVAAVDRVGPVQEALVDAGMRVEGRQLQASRLSALPDGSSRLAAANPVFLLWGDRP
jgi:precorrin-6Y C5,15-methyltransferase (decarboxylating)